MSFSTTNDKFVNREATISFFLIIIHACCSTFIQLFCNFLFIKHQCSICFCVVRMHNILLNMIFYFCKNIGNFSFQFQHFKILMVF